MKRTLLTLAVLAVLLPLPGRAQVPGPVAAFSVLGYDPFISTEKAAEQGIELYRDVDALLVKCDFVTVHTPLSDENLIDADTDAQYVFDFDYNPSGLQGGLGLAYTF